jgi:hypothetical protein
MRDEDTMAIITDKDINDRIKKLKKKTSPDPDGVDYESTNFPSRGGFELPL